MRRAAAAAASLAACAAGALAARAAAPSLSWTVDAATGAYALALDGQAWLASPAAPPTLCVAGAPAPLAFVSAANASGADAFGAWTGLAVTRATPGGVRVVETFQAYADASRLVATAAFPDGVDAAGSGAACGGNAAIRTAFPRFDTAAAAAPTLGFVSWRDAALGTTATALGLAALGQNSLDAGPVVAFAPGGGGGGGAPPPALVWSTLDAHKIVTQTTTGGGGGGGAVPGPVTALWSASRAEQVACLSAECSHDQVADGAYVAQRVEGYAVADAGGGPGTSACLNNATHALTPLAFAWNAAALDNWVGAAAGGGGGGGGAPGAGWVVMGGNGALLSAPAPGGGTLPLVAYFKAYNATHVDWAAVASPAGLAWAEANGYAARGTLGHVFTSPPVPCAAPPAAGGVYALGVSAAIPSIPVGWTHSVVFVGARGGPTAATYAYGDAIRRFKNTTRLPSVTLTDIGYYTDDGAYYYVWEAFNIPARPWPAEVGLQLVVADLHSRGVPVAYLQLDDWWYTGKFCESAWS